MLILKIKHILALVMKCVLDKNAALKAIKPYLENKIPNISSLVKKKKKQIIAQKLVKLKRKLLIIIMTNILLLQNLIRLKQKIFLQD